MTSTTPQIPIGSGFKASSTAEDVVQGIDLHGKNILVTGGYSGLGAETVRVLLKAGAHVFVPARDVARAKKATVGAGADAAIVEYMDLGKHETVAAYAAAFLARDIPLHVLINNAGIMALPTLQKDARGFELQFATNHLGHFQLTLLLKPALVKANGARVVSVSSFGHTFDTVHLDDVNFEHREYNGVSAYAQSKAANVLFALELDKRWQNEGIRAFSLHPGIIVDTGLAKHTSAEMLKSFGAVDAEGKTIHDPELFQFKNVHEGAATQVFAGVHPKLNGLGGAYLENSEITYTVGHAELKKPNGGAAPHALDHDLAKKLFDLSDKWVFGN